MAPGFFTGKGELTIEVNGIKAITGQLLVSVYNSESSWLNTDSAFRKVMVSVTNDMEEIVLEKLPEGDYAIALFQDLNGNEALDQTELKIPREPFGFSNNPKGLRGPASFSQAMFHFDGEQTLTINLVNNLFTPNKVKE